MNRRVLRIGVLVAVLFVVNAVARLVGRFAFGDGTAEHLEAQERLGWVGWGTIALTMAVAAAWWIRQRPQGEVAGELAGAAALAGLLYVTVGPFLSAPPRFDEGLGTSIIQVSIYLGVAGVGALVGALVMIALGRDYTSRSLKRFAESRSVKPRRR